VEGAELLAVAAGAMRSVRQRQALLAWWQYVQDQVGPTQVSPALSLIELNELRKLRLWQA
jgi:hypothetical protein